MKSFDKNVSNQMKALAMMFLLVHHLWAESRIGMYDATFIGTGGDLVAISKFCKLCVGIFMFISGYGLMTTYLRGTFKLQNRLKKIMFPFWFIIVLTVPLLLYMDEFSTVEVVKNAFLLSNSINGAWWFMQTYVLFVLLFPLFAKTFQKRIFFIPLMTVALVALQPLGVLTRPHSEDLHYVFHYFPLLYIGMYAKKINLFERLQATSMLCKIFITVVLLVSRLALGWSILNAGIIIVIILWVMQVQDMLHAKAKDVLNFLGRMTMNMWLIHMFFIQYGYHSSNPFIDLIWLYVESLITAYIVSLMYDKTYNLFGNMHNYMLTK